MVADAVATSLLVHGGLALDIDDLVNPYLKFDTFAAFDGSGSLMDESQYDIMSKNLDPSRYQAVCCFIAWVIVHTDTAHKRATLASTSVLFSSG